MTLDPLHISLKGSHLIEASAGTGKTYTITGLYVRLLLERQLAPEKILVVTFTEAACQELREGIRSRLAKALKVFGNLPSDDHFLTDLYRKYQDLGWDLDEARERIALALMDFDLAAVYTIHGFCMRVLQDSAFESGFLFETEFIENDSDLLQQVVDDYWRIHSQEWHPVFLTNLCHLGWFPDSLAARISSLLGPIQAEGEDVLKISSSGQAGNLEPDYFPKLAEIWQNEREEITGLLASDALSRSLGNYHPANLSRMFSELDDFFSSVPLKSSPIEAINKLARTTLLAGTKKSKTGETPDHEFFRLCDQICDQLLESCQVLTKDLAVHCCRELARVKEVNALVSFNDLLTGVRDSLRNEMFGSILAKRIAAQYPVAMIDEFQDTDPVQYEIFNRVYQEGPGDALFLVGDPKQAIYGFRGADIYAYLEAAGIGKAAPHTLDVNWRSEPGLINACNLLFESHSIPFVIPGIEFHPVQPPDSDKEKLVIQQQDDAPFKIYTFEQQQKRPDAKEIIAVHVTGQIQSLLALSEEGKACYELENDLSECQKKKLTPCGKRDKYLHENFSCSNGKQAISRVLKAGDIAILVRTHNDGELIRKSLLKGGIHSVIQSRQSVFESTQARELQLILEAVANPVDQKKIRSAFATSILAAKVPEFFRMEEDEVYWDEILLRFAEYNRIWRVRGVSPMLCQLFLTEGVYVRQAGRRGGERLLTNLRHLAELLQEACHNENLGVDELVAWFIEMRHDPSGSEAYQIRLESDENLVKIVTIHKSKGLQYPVVFCPFLWDSTLAFRKKQDYAICHDEDGSLLVDLGTRDIETHRLLQMKESLAEDLRLLYVALTRARNRCCLHWGRVQSRGKDVTASSALQYLLNGTGVEGDIVRELEESFRLNFDTILPQIEELARRSAGAIAVEPISEAESVRPAARQLGLGFDAVRELSRELNFNLGTRSFSSLYLTSETVDEPDHDQLHGGGDDVGEDLLPGTGSVFDFPKGAKPGSCLHAILEELDFQEKDNFVVAGLVSEKLELFGIDLDWAPTAHVFLDNLINTPLGNRGGNVRLAEISRKERLDELEFYFSIPAEPDSILRDIFYGKAKTDGGNTRNSKPAMMKGYIDLVFRWQEQFYIVDYKSNFLGVRPEDYCYDCLKDAVRHAGYDLQYQIYTVALHRYLKNRLPGYEYENNFGGVYYLFLRGLDPNTVTNNGIFYDRPDWQHVKELEKRLQG